MSTINQSAMKLLQYNKDLYKERRPIDSEADRAFGTWSYTNMYDALYDRFSRNKNFNIDMLHQAVKLGEQDQYFTLLEQNKDNTLSDKFYDSQYYDYETMMMELYLPLADNTKVEKYTQEVYDPASGKMITQDIGEMTQRQYYEYLLNSTRVAREEQINAQLEAEQKESLGWWKTFGGDILATVGEFGEGLLGGLAGAIDLFLGAGFATGYSGTALVLGDKENQNWLDAFVMYFDEIGLTAIEKRTLRAALNEYERTHTHIVDINGNVTNIGKYVAGISNSIGMMIPAIVVNYATGGAAFAGGVTFYSSIFSSNVYENRDISSPSWVKITNATVKTGAEALIEYSLGRLLGGTIQNQALGISGGSISKTATKGLSKSDGLKYFFKSAGQEGLEEFLQDFGTECVDQFTNVWYEGYGNTGLTFQTLVDSFFIGALSSMLMSGGYIALNAATSSIRNKKTPGSGDILIETEQGPEKVTGVNKLRFSQLLSDFMKAVNDLKTGKMSVKKNVGLAQEVYGAMSAISQFYSSFDKERIKNCEMLLDRVVKAEKFEEHYERAASILSPQTIAKITKSDKTVKQTVKTSVNERVKTLANNIKWAFDSMVGGVAERYTDKIHIAADEKKEALEEGGVTQAKEFIDTDGNSYKDPAIKDVEERLGKKAYDVIEELRKAYEWIIITDGHTAVETENHIFVSEAWLQNYSVSDIYRYLEQTHVLDAIAADKRFAPMIKRLIAFDKEFTGQTDVNTERALMDLLFNKSVYQAFLLSNAGKNAHEYKNFIFQLHELIEGLAKSSKYHQQLFKGKQAQTRINMLKQIYEQIKETMREPTLKAIYNWGFNPQAIGADSVLTPKDRELLNQYNERRRVIANAGKEGKDSSRYENLAEDIIEKTIFSEKQLDIINKSLNGTATPDEDLEARLLLDEADRYITTYDFEQDVFLTNRATTFAKRLRDIENNLDSKDAVLNLKDIIYDIDEVFQIPEIQANMPEEISALVEKWDKATSSEKFVSSTSRDDVVKLTQAGIIILEKYAEYNDSQQNLKRRKSIGLGAFTIPYHAAGLAMGGDIASAQLVADKLAEFQRLYGISARQMIMTDLSGMSIPQHEQLTQDMEALDVFELVPFVIRKLENMLGDDFVVTTTDYRPADGSAFDFVIAKKIPAERFINQDILDLAEADRDAIFRGMFESEKKSLVDIDLAEIAGRIGEDIDNALKNYDKMLDEHKKDLPKEYLRELDGKFDNRLSYNGVYALLESISKGVDPITGEVFFDTDTREILSQAKYDLFHYALLEIEMMPDSIIRKLSDFIDTSMLPDIDLNSITVEFKSVGPKAGGYATRNNIVVDPKMSNYFGVLVHEVNHILQYEYNMPNGFNPEAAERMPDFLAYVVNHYPNYVEFALFKNGYYGSQLKAIFGQKMTSERISKLSGSTREIIAHCAYMLTQGEMWARAYMHNGKALRGFTVTGNYIYAPDNRTKFKMRDSKSSMSAASPKISPELAGSALDVSIQKLFTLKWRQEREGSATTSRNTYHSALTKNSSTKLLYSILSPKVGIIDRTFVKLADVIKDPQRYLAPEILAKCNGDFSEGNVFYRLKEYAEANFKGISLDINDNQEYVWVDDNAFDDLLLVSMQTKAESDDISLVKQFKPHEKISLSKFYSQAELNRLGVDPKAYVLIDPTNGGTETIFDKEHRHGAIILDVDEHTTDASFINDLNHEFRHLLQYYNGFATGFTADFKVTKEMRDDVKKHLPELFKNQEIVKWAKKMATLRKVDNYEDFIVQRYVYYATSGELAAYAFEASDLYAKPVFVNMEAGKPTIFMSWYDAKTGEGRYQTDFLAMRTEKTEKVLKKKGKEGINLPMVEKKKDTRPRYFSKTKAKGTNLEYYKDTNQLDPRMQDFVIATTGHEDKLPPALWNAISKGKLTMQNFYTWFQKAKNIDEFTFNLINKHIFKNDFITSMEQLDELLTFDPAFYWAAAQVLRKRGLPLESLIAENNINKFIEFLKSLEGTKWYDEILEMTEKFTLFQTDTTEKGEPVYENIAADDKAMGQLRTLAMHYFNGTLAGAFYIGNTFKQTIYWNEMETRSKTKSADESLGDGMSDDKDVSLIDAIAEEDAALDENSRAIGNDIMALYELDSNDAEMYTDRLVTAKYVREVDKLVARLDLPEKAKTMLRQRLSDPDKLRKNYSALVKKENPTEQEKKQLKNFKFELAKYTEIMKAVNAFKEELNTLVPAEIIVRGTALVVAQMTNTSVDEKIFDLNARYTSSYSGSAQTEIIKNTLNEAGQKELEKLKDSDLKMDRINLQSRIRAASDKLIKYLKTNVITFDELPANVRDLFIVSTTNNKTLDYQLDKEKAYYVGKGRQALRGKNDMGRTYYVQKHNLTESNEAYRHDVSHLIEVDALLRATNEEIKKIVAERERLKTMTEKNARQLEERAVRAEKRTKKLETEVKELKENAKNMRTTEIRIAPKKKKRTSDTPNVFNIVSAIDMPYQLRKIFDTSFEEMANTEVQFASRDENGQLYDREQFKPGEFDSRIKHEVSNWDTFYEANRDALLSLTRNDVLDIIEFFQRGAHTIDGPANKLAAFEIFMLGYIVDGARRNFSNWNFSGKEIEIIEKLYEQKASTYGSGLNAVKQMLSVVDPMKKVRQRMFNDWTAISDDDKDNLINAVDALQEEKDPKAQIEKAQDIIQMLEEFGKRQMEVDKEKYPRWSKAWWSRLWSKTKSYRYMAMLSSPTTWIRNVISNVLVTSFNKTSDVLGKIVFFKKGYRKEQWNLSGTKISADAKNFIDTYILNNPIFSPLYDMSSKYDIRQNKKIADERNLLVNLIAKAYEKQYAQNRRFDAKVMNGITKFVDKMISDKRFVKFAAGRYFGKILTIEVERGNVDLSKGLSSEVLDLFADAVILANQEYMHKRSFGADLFDGIREKHPNMYEALTFWQPFINSSLNWFAESFKYTPMGLGGSIVRACKLEKQITKLNERREAGEMVVDSRTAEFLVRRDIGKGVLGLILSGFGVMLACSGRLRIDEDDEKFYAYIDEEIKLDITNLFGSSSLLAGASIAQLWIEQTDGSTATFEEALTLYTDTILDGFFAVDILERHKWGGTWDDILTETESVMRSFVPQMWQTIIACTNQEDIRYSRGFKGMWERWLNTFVPTQPFGNRKINPYTGELEDKYSLPILGGLLQKGILGPKVYLVEVSEVERMCRELDVNKSELTGELTVNDKKYKLDRFVLNTKYGELNKESLAKIKSQKHKVEMPNGTFKTLSWDKMDDKQRANVLSRTMTRNADIAKIYMWTQTMGKKFYASDSMWAELRKLGITKNVYKGDKGFVE